MAPRYASYLPSMTSHTTQNNVYRYETPEPRHTLAQSYDVSLELRYMKTHSVK